MATQDANPAPSDKLRIRDTQVQFSVASPSRRNGRNGNNRLEPGDRPVHSWYRFVLSYPSHLVRRYLDRFDVGDGATVLDPFCGTGTTLVECKKLGIASIGIESHPMAHFAARTKTDWTPDPGKLAADASAAASAVESMFASQRWLERPGQVPDDELLRLPEESARLLIRGSINPVPLHRALILLRHLNSDPARPGYAHQLLALAAALPGDIGNLHFGPEVGVRGTKPDAPVVSDWLRRVTEIAADIQTVRGGPSAASTVIMGDSREAIGAIAPSSIDVVITSPPYPNEKDYTRTTRLESVVLGFIEDREALRAVKRGLVRSNTRGVYRDDDDDLYLPGMPEVERIASKIESRRIELGKTSGFERQYPRVTRLYFGGMARHLAQLREILKPGARLAYVVGDQASYLRVMIRTGRLLDEIASQLGYEVESLDLFRERTATATRAKLREEVLVLRWLGERSPE